MGRRVVELTRQLIELVFEQGHEEHFRIIQGLPTGATLQGATLTRETLYLEFEHPDWPESSETLEMIVENLAVSGGPQMPEPQGYA